MWILVLFWSLHLKSEPVELSFAYFYFFIEKWTWRTLKRPNICRLFPLGRVYKGDDFKYFLQVGNCPKDDLKDVKVSQWVGIENYDENKKFILDWHKFIKALTFRLKFVRDEKEIDKINQTLLDSCYHMNIKEGEDFYSLFIKNLPEIKNRLGII